MQRRRTPDEQAHIDALIDRLTCVALADESYVTAKGRARKIPVGLDEYATCALMGVWVDAEANKQAMVEQDPVRP